MSRSAYFLALWAELPDGTHVYPYKGVRGDKKDLYSVNFTDDNKKFEGVTEQELVSLVESGRFASRGVIRMLPLNAKPGADRNAFSPTHYSGKRIEKTSPNRTPRNSLERQPDPFATELDPQVKYTEGSTTQILVNSYERSASARRACLAHHGHACKACGFDFGTRYGEVGRGFIHVHHVVKISSVGKEYVVNPVTDLIPVCPNCHAMLHQSDPPLSIEDLRVLIREARIDT
jgi:5-methylcytosine-specific restriction endonuclease McrA